VLTSESEVLLDVKALQAGYGKINVLQGIDLQVRRGEIVALLGPNGAGKTTLLRAVSGLLPWNSGSVTFAGADLRSLGPRGTTRLGLSHVIEGHRVFTSLSVTDNLSLAGYDLKHTQREERVEEAFSLFPEIAEKRHLSASTLSGGQQQMLAVAQGLVRRPKLLMLDEPSAGLSPVLVDRVLAVVTRIKASGTAVILVEQLVEKAIGVSDRVVALARGQIVLDETSTAANLSAGLQDAYLGHADRQVEATA